MFAMTQIKYQLGVPEKIELWRAFSAAVYEDRRDIIHHSRRGGRNEHSLFAIQRLEVLLWVSSVIVIKSEEACKFHEENMTESSDKIQPEITSKTHRQFDDGQAVIPL